MVAINKTDGAPSAFVNNNKNLSAIMEDHDESTTMANPLSSGFNDVKRDTASWAGGSLPAAQGLYNPDNERDSCGVGFVAQIKGELECLFQIPYLERPSLT